MKRLWTYLCTAVLLLTCCASPVLAATPKDAPKTVCSQNALVEMLEACAGIAPGALEARVEKEVNAQLSTAYGSLPMQQEKVRKQTQDYVLTKLKKPETLGSAMVELVEKLPDRKSVV